MHKSHDTYQTCDQLPLWVNQFFEITPLLPRAWCQLLQRWNTSWSCCDTIVANPSNFVFHYHLLVSSHDHNSSVFLPIYTDTHFFFAFWYHNLFVEPYSVYKPYDCKSLLFPLREEYSYTKCCIVTRKREILYTNFRHAGEMIRHLLRNFTSKN